MHTTHTPTHAPHTHARTRAIPRPLRVVNIEDEISFGRANNDDDDDDDDGGGGGEGEGEGVFRRL